MSTVPRPPPADVVDLFAARERKKSSAPKPAAAEEELSSDGRLLPGPTAAERDERVKQERADANKRLIRNERLRGRPPKK